LVWSPLTTSSHDTDLAYSNIKPQLMLPTRCSEAANLYILTSPHRTVKYAGEHGRHVKRCTNGWCDKCRATANSHCTVLWYSSALLIAITALYTLHSNYIASAVQKSTHLSQGDCQLKPSVQAMWYNSTNENGNYKNLGKTANIW